MKGGLPPGLKIIIVITIPTSNPIRNASKIVTLHLMHFLTNLYWSICVNDTNRRTKKQIWVTKKGVRKFNHHTLLGLFLVLITQIFNQIPIIPIDVVVYIINLDRVLN